MRIRKYIYSLSTAVHTKVTTGVDALPGPDSWSAVITHGYAEIQYNSQPSTHISFVYEHCFSRKAGGSITCFPTKLFGRWPSGSVGNETRVYGRKQYENTGSEIHVHARTQKVVRVSRFQTGVENGPIFFCPYTYSCPRVCLLPISRSLLSVNHLIVQSYSRRADDTCT